MSAKKGNRQIEAARELVRLVAEELDPDASVRLWDGSTVPLGRDVKSSFALSIAGPGVIGSLLRRPTLDNIIRHYAHGRIDFSGGSLIDFGAQLNREGRSKGLKRINKLAVVRSLAPFLLAPAGDVSDQHGFTGDIRGRSERKRDNMAFTHLDRKSSRLFSSH